MGWTVMRQCLHLLLGTDHVFGPLLSSRYPLLILMYGACCIVSTLASAGALCFLSALPGSLCDDVIAVRRAIDGSDPDPARARRLYDVLLQRMGAIRLFYTGYGIP